ncbi:MAG: MFS transporter [Legionellaceae bacterium]|nr:MFS transporter [Legionellaceae bacterium]
MGETPNRHPASLGVFCATEAWERYGFYVIQTLLALYLTSRFGWEDNRVYAMVGSFTALTYMSPIIGGWVADYLLGQKRAILLGLVVLFASYLSLSLFQDPALLIYGLAGLAIGTGLIKPNISSLLGNQYQMNSPYRERGFTIFYMGITVGIILGTTIPSPLTQLYGWQVAFGSAALGMIMAFLTFTTGIYYYDMEDYNPFETTYSKWMQALALLGVSGLLSFTVLQYPALANAVFFTIFIIAVIYMCLTIKNEERAQSLLTVVIGLLCIVSILFWAFYFQMFMSLTLFIARVANPQLFGIHFPAPYYVCVQSLGMLVFGFILTRNQKKLNRTESGLRTNNKFTLSIVVITLAYALICLISWLTQFSIFLLSPLLIIPAYLLISIAELLLSPIGLAAITTLSDRTRVSTMMGIFFVSLGLGGFLSGKLAILTALPTQHMGLIEVKVHYAHGFFKLFTILVMANFLSLLINYLCRLTLRQHAYYAKH